MTDGPPGAPQDPPQEAHLLTSFHVRRAREGEPGSLAWLIGRFTPVLLVQAAHHLGPELRRHTDPEDLVQEVWGVVLRNLPAIGLAEDHATRTLLAYCSAVLLNQVRNLVRKHIAGKPPREEAREGADSKAPGPLSALQDETTGIVSRTIRAERGGVLRSCIEELDEKDRQIIILCGLEQRSRLEIGVLLGLTPDQIALRYHRALKRLRERLPGSVFHDLADAWA